jgi:hemerythrin
MAMVTWNDNLSVNVAEIDLQHKKLVGLINELFDAMKIGKGKDVTGKILDGLISYTATHFTQEERYFDKFGYPDKIKHKKEHSDFVQKVKEFKEGFDSGKVTLTIEVMNFLSDWLFKHIKVTDKNYSKFFNEKGLK